MVDDPTGACDAFEAMTAKLDMIGDRKIAELDRMHVSVDEAGFSVWGMPAATVVGDPRFFRVTELGVVWNDDPTGSRPPTGPLPWGRGRVGIATVATGGGYECTPLDRAVGTSTTTSTTSNRTLEDELASYAFTYDTAVCSTFGIPSVTLHGWKVEQLVSASGEGLEASSQRAVEGDLTGDGIDETVTIETCGPRDREASTPPGTQFQPWGPIGSVATVSVVSKASDGSTQTLWTVLPALAPARDASIAPAWIYRGDLVTNWFLTNMHVIEVDYRWDGAKFSEVRRIVDGTVSVSP